MNVEVILILVVLTNLRLLGSSRLGASIRTVAVQGLLIGLLPLLAPDHGLLWHVLVLGIGSMALKGVVFPRLLLRALREADVSRHVEEREGRREREPPRAGERPAFGRRAFREDRRHGGPVDQ